MDKQKQIEEMAKVLSTVKRCDTLAVSECIKKKCEYPHYSGVTCIAEHQAESLYNAGYRKIPEGAVVIPKEISCYENIEKRVRAFRIDGNKVDFTDEQIMALTQIFHIKERNENEIRNETAEKFAEMLKAKFAYDIERCKAVDEICKEITEGKNG